MSIIESECQDEDVDIEDICMVCGKRAEVGVHGFKDGEIVSEHYCERCYTRKVGRKGRPPGRPRK